MTSSGEIYRISVSDRKGDKKINIEEARLLQDFGIEGDAHAGSDRQVSLLPFEAFDPVREKLADIKPGDFAENLTTVGIDLSGVTVGDRFLIGHDIRLVVTQIGKTCHHGCYIREQVGDCIMPRVGLFARVEQGGQMRIGDAIRWEPASV